MTDCFRWNLLTWVWDRVTAWPACITKAWPELTFDIFPVGPTEKGREAYLDEPG